MRCAVISAMLAVCACALGAGKVAAPKAPSYRIGKAPKPEFKVGAKSYKIDPAHKSVKQIRELSSEHFDPITRRDRVAKFYRETLKERYEELHKFPHYHCGPFRHEFIYWVHRHWRANLRARWAWHHRIYLDELLWKEWMTDAAFASEIAVMQKQNVAPDVGFLPTEYAPTSPVAIYNDEYMDAVYNPLPFLAVLSLKSLNPDAKTDWIGAATADSLLSKLSSVPGLFVADRQMVSGALKDPKGLNIDASDPTRVAQIGKAVDVERVVAGSYVVDGDKVLFNLRIVDVQSGAVQNGISKTIPRDKLLDEMPGLAVSLATALGYDVPDESVATAAGSAPVSIPTQPNPTAPRTGSIFDPGVPSVPSRSASPARRTFTASDKISEDINFTAADGPYEIQDKLTAADGVKNYRLIVGPGADIHGGTLVVGGGGHIEINGTPEKPAVLRHIYFEQKLGGSFKARYAIFEDCKFRKGGAYFSRSGFSSKWELDKCLIRGSSTFPRITHVDYGIKLTDCTFSGLTFEEIAIGAPKDKPLDHMDGLRKDWRTIDRCRFDGCTVPPTIFWCATASNYTHCTFASGPAFESDTATDVVAYVADTAGEAPDKIAAASPPKRAALKITYATTPFQIFSFSK